MRILLALFLCGSLCFAGETKIFNGQGKPFAKRQGQTQEPKIIVDTVRIVAGFGSLSLTTGFTSRQHRTAATSASNVFAQISRLLTDSTKDVYSYSYSVADKGARLVIKSSGGTADTGKVVVTCIVK
jgi:hypothetical protein